MNYRDADLNPLKVFEALMNEGNVTRAAQKLSLTQPMVSDALRRLRETYGAPLFVATAQASARPGAPWRCGRRYPARSAPSEARSSGRVSMRCAATHAC